MKWKYVVDTNVILRRTKYDTYEKDSFPIHWKNFDDLILHEAIISAPLVKTEMNNHPKRALLDWPEENDIIFKKLDDNVVNSANILSSKFPVWYEKNTEEDKPWADPQLIAFAMAYNIVLVTQEDWNLNATEEHNYKIPTICSKLGAYCKINSKESEDIDNNVPFQCIDFFELIKRESLHG
ncbi:MAG: DUF4411 family protein [Methanobacteriaceae archaeon]|nr:DUF4411 family protein [Methanobacteriaceae archaeon]